MQDPGPFPFFPYQAIVDRPRIVWPNGARLAVWVIPNIEHFHIEIGKDAPDIRNHSRRDYGNRVGVWRIMEVLAKHGIRGTVALNAEVGRFYPRIMEEAARLKWELMGHGLTNSVRPQRPRKGQGSLRHRRNARSHRAVGPKNARLARAGPDRDVAHARSASATWRRVRLRFRQRRSALPHEQWPLFDPLFDRT